MTSTPSRPSRPDRIASGWIVDVVPVAVAALLLLALVGPWYATRPFWFDELVSMEIADLSPGVFVDYLFTVEVNMALYHALLAAWQELGTSEATVRVLSIVLALATLPYLYGLGRRIFDRRTAVIGVLLMSVNVSFVGYARDARGYALALLLVTASSYHLARAVQSSRRREWALYALTAALAIWAHMLAALVITAQVVWLISERRVPRSRRALVAVGAAGALALPIAAALVVGGQRAHLEWLEQPRLRQLPGLLEWFVEDRATVVVYVVGVAIALATARGEWRKGRGEKPRWHLLLLLWLLLPPLTAFVVSYAHPIYLYRYFLVCLPALVLLASAGFARVRPAWLGLALAAAALALSARTVVSCQPDCKIRHDDWATAAAYLETLAQPGDRVVAYPAEVRTPYDHYLGDKRLSLIYPEKWSLIGGSNDRPPTIEAATADVVGGQRIWLLTWWLPAERARDAVSRRARLVSSREFPGNVSVELYRSPG